MYVYMYALLLDRLLTAAFSLKVDIKSMTPGDGLLYYESHLPVLGKPSSNTQETPPSTQEDKNKVVIASGDLVRVQIDLELFKALQEGHGGWNDGMVDVSECWCL